VLAATITEATIVLGIPKTVPDGELIIYLYHDGSQDLEKAGPSLVQRTHTIPIHVLLRMSVGDTEEAAELELMGLHDRICNAFYADHTLGGLASNAVIGQRDQPRGAAAGAYVFEGTSEYRHRWWTLMAQELLSFAIS
jgi:hypothetical protein